MPNLGPEDMDLAERFEGFYRDYCHEDILHLVQHYPQEQQSLWIEARDLYRWDQEVLQDWREQPEKLQQIAEEALSNYDVPLDIDLENAHVRLTDTNDYIERHSVASLDSSHINDYVAVRGQLDKVSEKIPYLNIAAWECQQCGKIQRIPQGMTEVHEAEFCSGCEKQGPFELDVERSEFIDLRRIKLAQPPSERAGSNSSGEDINVIVKDDLAAIGGSDELAGRSGEIATVLGVWTVDTDKFSARNASPDADMWLSARAIEFEDDGYDDIDLDEYRDDIEELKERDSLIDDFRDSIVPSLNAEGTMETALEGAVAYLFNAYRVDPASMQRSMRGDLHMALIGDPGQGKSTVLQSIHNLCPKSEFAGGADLTAAGLTAAAVQEEFMGTTEWVLQAGLLPKAPHTIIDEIDAAVDSDTKAMHNAMGSRQRVDISKAGMNVSLKTETAVAMGGNPVDGSFNRHDSIPEQIDLDGALVDRVDILLAIEDDADPEKDRDTAEHVVESWDEATKQQLYEDGERSDEPEIDYSDAPVEKDLFSAAIKYARQNVYPTLTDDAKQILKEFYVDVRSENGYADDEPVPATPRTLETGIRLSTAYARAEFSETVEQRHAERAKTITKHVVGLNYDPESGTFDAARTGKGTPKSQRDRIKTIKDLIADIEREYDEGAPVDVVTEKAGMSESDAEHYIEKLKENGEVYSPRTDHLRTS